MRKCAKQAYVVKPDSVVEDQYHSQGPLSSLGQ